jgi:signal transduction histidine kinase
MKELIRRGILFVKTNPTIISSFLLIIIVLGALFLNSFLTLERFQKEMDKTLRTKAVLGENILGFANKEYFEDISKSTDIYRAILNDIKGKSNEIEEISVYAADDYRLLISTEDKNSKQEDSAKDRMRESAKKFAATTDDAFAYLDNISGHRSWNVIKAVKKSDGSVGGILLMKLSLADSDVAVRDTIFQTYAISVIAMIVVLLLILNHARLFSYELKAKKLEEIDKMKDDFISMASHELKSPLVAIRGYVELLGDDLKKGGDVVEERMSFLKNIDTSAQRLNLLVEDILNVSRIEQNRLPVEIKKIDIKKYIDEAFEEMKVVADKKNLAMNNAITSTHEVMADSQRASQILINLLSNAIKYTPSGFVNIESREDKDFVYIIVADSGLGISSENMKKLFTKFYRIQNEATAKISGTGLGLWISREIARKMGGDLIVESIEGVGSHFTLKLKK